MFHARALAFLALLLLLPFAFAEEDYIIIDASISQQPVRFVFDTGAGHSILVRPAVRRLNLESQSFPKDATTASGGWRVACTVSFGRASGILHFEAVDLPPAVVAGMKADGILGWRDVAGNALFLPGGRQRLYFMRGVPNYARQWTRWELMPRKRTLTIRVPFASGEAAVMIDTGAAGDGVLLSAARWDEWRRANPDAPATIGSSYTPSAGFVCREVCWATRFSIGRLAFTSTTVQQMPEAMAVGLRNPDAVVGLHALSGLDILIDAPHQSVYTQPVLHGPSRLDYSRTGMGFAPKNSRSGPLLVSVVAGGPAHRAGVRDGDVLLSIDGLDCTRWEEDPTVLTSRDSFSPAGTRLEMRLERDGHPYTTMVECEEIFPLPGAGAR